MIDEEELFRNLKELHVTNRLSDINMPNKDFIIRVIDLFIKDLNIDIYNSQSKFENLKDVEHPEAFQDIQMLLQVVRFLNKITSPAGLNVTIRDIIEPKPKRTKRLLYYLTVFWVHCLQMQAKFKDVEEGLMEEKKQADDLFEEVSELKGRREAALENIEPNKEELQSYVSYKIEKAKEFEKQYKAVTDEYELVLKKKEKDLDEKCSSLEVNILSAKEQISEIEQLILASPDRLSTDLQRLKDIIKSEDIKIREKELEIKDKKKRQETINKTNELNQKSLEVLRDIKHSLNDFCNTADCILSCNNNLENEEEQLKKVESELEKKDKLKSIYLEKQMKISLNTKKQKESMELKLVSLKKKVTDEDKALDTLKSKTANIKPRINEEADFIIEICSVCEQAENRTESKYAEYVSQTEAMEENFRQDCEEVKDSVKETFKK